MRTERDVGGRGAERVRSTADAIVLARRRGGAAAGFSILIGLVSTLGASSTTAGDIAAGREAASQCKVCHGADGIAVVPEAPNLAGESSIYIEKQLMAFKRGEREHQQMSIIAQGLDEKTIRDLAAWYDAMEVTVVVPE